MKTPAMKLFHSKTYKPDHGEFPPIVKPIQWEEIRDVLDRQAYCLECCDSTNTWEQAKILRDISKGIASALRYGILK